MPVINVKMKLPRAMQNIHARFMGASVVILLMALCEERVLSVRSFSSLRLAFSRAENEAYNQPPYEEDRSQWSPARQTATSTIFRTTSKRSLEP
jgi:hypothetical protein